MLPFHVPRLGQILLASIIFAFTTCGVDADQRRVDRPSRVQPSGRKALALAGAQTCDWEEYCWWVSNGRVSWQECRYYPTNCREEPYV